MRGLVVGLLLVLVVSTQCQNILPQISFFNALSGTNNVLLDLFDQNVPVARFVTYRRTSVPLYVNGLSSGVREFSARNAGGATVRATRSFDVSSSVSYTIVASGRTDVDFDPELHIIDDNEFVQCPVASTQARFRFCHFAPGEGPIDIVNTATNEVLIRQLSFARCSFSLNLFQGAFALQVRESGVRTAVNLLPSSALIASQANTINTVFFTGVREGAPLTPLVLTPVTHSPCAAPLPFQVVPPPIPGVPPPGTINLAPAGGRRRNPSPNPSPRPSPRPSPSPSPSPSPKPPPPPPPPPSSS